MSNEHLIQSLSLEEKVSLLAGKSYWRTAGLSKYNIKPIKVQVPQDEKQSDAKAISSTVMDLMAFAENQFMRQLKLPAFPAQRWWGRPSTLIWPLKWVKQ